MSKNNTIKDTSIPIHKQLENYHYETRYKLALRLTIILTIVFAVLSYSEYDHGLHEFLTMFTGVVICFVCFLYTILSKKFLPVFWILSLSGILFTSVALFTLDTVVHYADFLWLFSSVILAFFGINKRIGIVLILICFITIIVYVNFFLNANLITLQRIGFQQNIMLTVELIGSMGSGMYVLYLFAEHHYFSVQLMTNINEELQLQNDTIDSKSNENETLIKEVHHRVKNNLQIITSLLRMQSNELEHDDSKIHFDEAIKRVMTMSLIHQKLYQNRDLSEINLKNYLESLTHELTQFMDEDQMSISTNIHVEKIGMKTIVPLGLLINELVSNSIKYVIPQKEFAQIFVNFESTDDGYLLTYQDNGSWEEENNLSENESTGFGTELIEILTEQMEGTKTLTKGMGNSKYEFKIKNLDLN